jgi:hypothetical protein
VFLVGEEGEVGAVDAAVHAGGRAGGGLIEIGEGTDPFRELPAFFFPAASCCPFRLVC